MTNFKSTVDSQEDYKQSMNRSNIILQIPLLL